MSASVFIGLSGLHDSMWAEGYFPEDLPEDWRVGFVSNEFDCLLLSRTEIRDVDVDDVSEGFRFLVEGGDEPAGEYAGLGAHLLAVLSADPSRSDRTDAAVWGSCPDTDENQRCWRSGVVAEGIAVEWEVAAVPEPMAMRLYIEAFLQTPDLTQRVLVFSGPAAPDTARLAKTMVELMGL